MRKPFRAFIVLYILIVFSSCKSEDYKSTENGILYHFYNENKNARVPKTGEILELNMTYYTDYDSLLFNTREIPGTFRMQMKAPVKTGGTIDEAIAMMHEGDSASFMVDAELFYTHSRRMDVPEYIKPDSKIKFYIKLNKILSYEEFEKERSKSRVNEQSEEADILRDYLENANITIAPNPSGLYYIESKPGLGRQPQKGNAVTVNYTGTLLDGKVFDSSYKRGVPFKFIVGANQVIPGFDEGIQMMKEGGSATLIIPSIIAYGARGKEDIIPPYSTLVFEIELLEVK